MSDRLPMFPLGNPLLPGVGLPLQVFEPRYLEMMDQVLATDRRFGVVLITRGHEVGGGDLRADVGTSAEVVSHDSRRDGRRLVLAIGRERLRVVRWLRDDPYPLAEVEAFPDPHPGASPDDGLDPPADHAPPSTTLADLQARMDQLVALVADHVSDEERTRLVEASRLPDDLDTAVWQATLVADLGPLDTQRLLEVPSRLERLELLDVLLRERRDVVAFSLGEPDG